MHAGNVLDNLGDGGSHNDHDSGDNHNHDDKQDVGEPERPTNKL